MPTSLELLNAAPLAGLGDAVPQLRNELLSARAIDEVLFEINIETNPVTRVAKTLGAIDSDVRRALALLKGDPAYTAYGTIWPLPPVVAGLLISEVEIGSYRGKHYLHGDGRTYAQKHPWICGVVCSVLANYALYYLPAAQLQAESSTPGPRPGVPHAPPAGVPPQIQVSIDGVAVSVPMLPQATSPDCALAPQRRGLADNEVHVVIKTDKGTVEVTYSAR